MADVSKIGHFSSNIYDESDPTSPLVAALVISKIIGELVDCNDFLGLPVERLLDFTVTACVALYEPLFRWCFCTKYPLPGPYYLIFQRALALIFAFHRLLCHLSGKCVSIEVAVTSRHNSIC